jgi:hypothetical protein
MKTSAAKKKVQDTPALIATRGAGKKLAIPTLLDRVNAICQEAEDAIDAACAVLKQNAQGVPIDVLKQMTMARGGGKWCPCEAYRRLMRDGGV